VNCGYRNILMSSNTEAITKTGMVMLLGEITSKAIVDYQKVVRDTIRKVGYTDSSQGKYMIFILILIYQHIGCVSQCHAKFQHTI